jgi:hypothetical protein
MQTHVCGKAMTRLLILMTSRHERETIFIPSGLLAGPQTRPWPEPNPGSRYTLATIPDRHLSGGMQSSKWHLIFCNKACLLSVDHLITLLDGLGATFI